MGTTTAANISSARAASGRERIPVGNWTLYAVQFDGPPTRYVWAKDPEQAAARFAPRPVYAVRYVKGAHGRIPGPCLADEEGRVL